MTVAETATPEFQISRVYRQTFSTILNNGGVFVMLSLIPGLASAALAWGQNRIKPPALFMSPPGQGTFAFLILAGIVYFSSWFFLQGALVHGVTASFSGKRASLSGTVATGLDRFFPLLLIGLISVVALIAAALLLVVPAIIVAVMWFVVSPVCVVERAGIGESLSRSAELTKGYRWPIFGLGLIYFIPAILLLLAINTLVGGDLFPRTEADVLSAEGTALIMRLLGEAFGTMVTWTFLSTLVASTYYELRQIKEGIGPESLASVFD